MIENFQEQKLFSLKRFRKLLFRGELQAIS